MPNAFRQHVTSVNGNSRLKLNSKNKINFIQRETNKLIRKNFSLNPPSPPHCSPPPHRMRKRRLRMTLLPPSWSCWPPPRAVPLHGLLPIVAAFGLLHFVLLRLGLRHLRRLDLNYKNIIVECYVEFQSHSFIFLNFLLGCIFLNGLENNLLVSFLFFPNNLPVESFPSVF